MQIRARVADSLIHVRGLWFRAMRTAAYTRGIKEFVLEFYFTGARVALYNVTRAGHPSLSLFTFSFFFFLAVFLFPSRFVCFSRVLGACADSIRHRRRAAGNDR